MCAALCQDVPIKGDTISPLILHGRKNGVSPSEESGLGQVGNLPLVLWCAAHTFANGIMCKLQLQVSGDLHVGMEDSY